MKYFTKFRKLISLVGLICVLVSTPVRAVGPVVDVWYGDNQVFGNNGTPQRWVNVLGNVSDPNGVSDLDYSLNGGPYGSLTIGPDDARLDNAGDFNVELSIDDLLIGQNILEIRGTNSLDEVTTQVVNFQYSSNYWSNPYSIDWSAASSIQDFAQIVDGQWELDGDSIRPVETGYDRLVTIGDRFWQNYEVTVEVTVNWVDTEATRPGVGILARWDGHHDWDGQQPNVGWWPMGALAWYRYEEFFGTRLNIVGNEGDLKDIDYSGKEVVTGLPYLFKVRVETPVAGEGTWYRFRVWQQGQPEPVEWDAETQEEVTDPQNGSILLVAHHVDASFGDFSVVPLAPDNQNDPPVLSNLDATIGDTSAAITWLTDKPTTSSVEFGVDASYGSSVVATALNTAHSVLLAGLIPETTYHFRAISEDFQGLTVMSADQTFTTTAAVDNTQLSDGFDAGTLDPRWSV